MGNHNRNVFLPLLIHQIRASELGENLLKNGKVCKRNFLMFWVFQAFFVYEMVLERYMFRLLNYRLIDDGIWLIYKADVSNLFDLRFYKKLILLIVHYFIDYSNLTHHNPLSKLLELNSYN
jgi:hypothetical protein